MIMLRASLLALLAASANAFHAPLTRQSSSRVQMNKAGFWERDDFKASQAQAAATNVVRPDWGMTCLLYTSPSPRDS